MRVPIIDDVLDWLYGVDYMKKIYNPKEYNSKGGILTEVETSQKIKR